MAETPDPTPADPTPTDPTPADPNVDPTTATTDPNVTDPGVDTPTQGEPAPETQTDPGQAQPVADQTAATADTPAPGTIAEAAAQAHLLVVADTDIDEGIARVYAAFNELPFERHPAMDEAEHFVLIGAAGERYVDDYGLCTVIAGQTRVETAQRVAEELRGGYRSTVLDYDVDDQA